MKKLISFIVLLSCCFQAFSFDAASSYSKANKLYQESKFEEAAKTYEAVLLSGNESAELYFNLGNAYFKQSKFPQAILNFERALRLAPGDEDIRFNIQVANLRIVDKIEPMPEIFYNRWINDLKSLFSADGWGRSSIYFLLLSIAAGIFYSLSEGLGIIRKISFYLASFALAISLLALAFGYNEYQQIKEAKSAIVFTPTLHVKSSPNENGTNIFVVHEGTKVELQDRVNNWVKIRLADGNIGWVPEHHVVVI